MKSILFCAYRGWAIEIYDTVAASSQCEGQFFLWKTKDGLSAAIKDYDPDLIFFIGWSWMVPSSIIHSRECICLHPSPLPLYRGGSPIQHQVINGESHSAVTIFKMDEGIDTGPILFQKEFSLDGTLDDIFNRIKGVGVTGVKTIVQGNYQSTPQDDQRSSSFKRRTKDMSEININDFNAHTATEIFNKVRCLQDPYPLPFVVCKGNTKLYLKEVTVGNDQ
jgi:methionyl-tRNA formyltransferase